MAKLLESRKVEASLLVSDLEKLIARKIIERGGRVSRPELEGILREVEGEKGARMTGILARLIDEGLLVRVRVPGIGSIYALSAEGAKKAGIIRIEEAPTEAEVKGSEESREDGAP